MIFSNSPNFSRIQYAFLFLMCAINFSSFGQNRKDFSLPLYFEKNQGQFADSQIKFQSHQGLATYSFGDNGVKVKVQSETSPNTHEWELLFKSSSKPTLQAKDLTKINLNYFQGKNASDWLTNVPNYQELIYRDVYPNTDIRFYGTQKGLAEYDVVVNPMGDVSKVKLEMKGVENLKTTSDSKLSFQTSIGELFSGKPFAYQMVNDKQIEVPVRYIIENNEISFELLADYNHEIPLIIDPLLLDWSTYLSNNLNDKLVNSLEENGFTYNILYNQGDKTVKVIKLNPDGGIVYINALSGAALQQEGVQASVENGAIALGMVLGASSLPVLNGRSFSGRLDSYITKLDANGQMVFGTHIGGPGVTTSEGNTFLTGANSGFSTTNAGMVLKNGKVFMAGYTNSVDLQPTANAAQSVKVPIENISWVGVIGNTGTLDYLSYYGDNSGSINAIKADAQNFYIVGGERSTNAVIPLVNPIAGVGNQYGFIAKFNHAGTILGSTKVPSRTTGYGSSGSLENSMDVVNGKIYFFGITTTPITTTPNAVDNTFDLSTTGFSNDNGVIGVLDANFQIEYLSYTSDRGSDDVKVGPDGSIYKISRNPASDYPNYEYRLEKISPTYGFSSTPYQATDKGFWELQEGKVVWVTKTTTSGLSTTPNATELVYQGTGDKLYISILNTSNLSPVVKTYLGGMQDVSYTSTSGAPLRYLAAVVVKNGNAYLEDV
jgi:hypothetical protein